MLKYMKNAALTEAPAPLTLKTVNRRSFLQIGAALGGFTLAAYASPASAFVKYPTGGDGMPRGISYDPMAFVAIDADGTVTITAHRSEMGTGSRTSLPMVVAEEMNADWDRVKIVQAPGDEPKYGNQDTDGSRSMRHHIQSMRQIGASVRHMLAEAAAKEWGIDASKIIIENHEIKGGGITAGFGDFAAAAMELDVPARRGRTCQEAQRFSRSADSGRRSDRRHQRQQHPGKVCTAWWPCRGCLEHMGRDPRSRCA